MLSGCARRNTQEVRSTCMCVCVCVCVCEGGEARREILSYLLHMYVHDNIATQKLNIVKQHNRLFY